MGGFDAAFFLYLCGMKEELTTKMHSEFMENEESANDMKIMGVYSSMYRNKSLKKALEEYKSVSKEAFVKNIVRVLGYDDSYSNEFFDRISSFLDV